MDTKNFNEMVAFDFSNLNVQQGGNDNCFTCEAEPCVCDCDCDCDVNCDSPDEYPTPGYDD